MDEQRLDKWLWCARFYKTRSLAQAAIKAGHVSVNGERPKPSRGLCKGDRLLVRRSPLEYAVLVIGLAKQRVSAALVPTLYHESAESIARREHISAQLKMANAIEATPPGGLDRRARRARVALKRSHFIAGEANDDG